MHESSTLGLVMVILALMLTASLTAVASRRLRLPFTILLVLIGLGLGAGARGTHALEPLLSFKLTPDVVLFVFLPVLLFESAFNLDARRLMKNALPVAMLAIPGLLISTALVGLGVSGLLGVALPVALLFGALISATDPVAVVALFREMGAPKRLGLLVEGESLFNDGTALVVFKILLGIVAAGVFTSHAAVEGVISFIVVAAGGIATGTVLGVLFAKVIEWVDNEPMVEVTLTTILAHTAFITAEHGMHVSGVMACVAAGLTMGGYGRTKISPQVVEHMEVFWEYFAFVCNSLIFLLVGLSLQASVLAAHAGQILIAFGVVIVARGAAVFGLFPVLHRLKGIERVSPAYQTVIAWGGLRGALAIVMALSIPHDLAERELLMTLTFGIVLLSLVVNGLTIKKVMAWLGLDKYSHVERLERAQAMYQARRSSLDALEQYGEHEGMDPEAVARTSETYSLGIESVGSELEALRTTVGVEDEGEVLLRHCLMMEKGYYLELFEAGVLSEANLRDMHIAIERQLDRLKEGRKVYVPGRSRIERALHGLTEALVAPLGPLVSWHRTRLIASHFEVERARMSVSLHILGELAGMEEGGTASKAAVARARALYEGLHAKASERVAAIRAGYPEYVEKVEEGMLERFCLGSELEAYAHMFHEGALPDKVMAEMREHITGSLRRMGVRPVQALKFPPRELLVRVPFFSGLGTADLDRIATLARARSYLPGQDVVREGGHGDSLFIIGRGEVDVFTSGADGAETRLARLMAGDFFGETALLHPQPRTATVRAHSPCTLLELTRAGLMPLLGELPEVRETLERAYRTRVLGSLIAHAPALAALSAEQREALVARMEYRHYEAGQEIGPCAGFILKSGTAEVGGGRAVEAGQYVEITPPARARATSKAEAYVVEGSGE
jgi:CPA1 family monovalent cation:H+ antiporter